MGSYSIRELETLSGIKAHTIRIWEKRHNLIAPKRTETNIRYYSDSDLKKIINVSLLNGSGIKISRIAGMSELELNHEVAELTSIQSDANQFIDQLIICMIDMEEEQFEKLLSHLIMKFGFEKTVTDTIYPFLEKIGVLWQTENISPAQEHFISNLVRQKIIVAIDSLPFPPKDAAKVVLFLPENELHEIGLLFYHFLIRKLGFRIYYLGQHLPYKDLKQICELHNPKFIVTSVTSSQKPQKTLEYFNSLIQDFPNMAILASGGQATQILPQASNLKIFNNSNDLKSSLIDAK